MLKKLYSPFDYDPPLFRLSEYESRVSQSITDTQSTTKSQYGERKEVTPTRSKYALQIGSQKDGSRSPVVGTKVFLNLTLC